MVMVTPPPSHGKLSPRVKGKGRFPGVMHDRCWQVGFPKKNPVWKLVGVPVRKKLSSDDFTAGAGTGEQSGL